MHACFYKKLFSILLAGDFTQVLSYRAMGTGEAKLYRG